MVSYFAMATGLGIADIATKYTGPRAGVVHLFREVYYAREYLASVDLPHTQEVS